jgi:acyl-CoA-dependent ceramide synthase
MITFIQHVPAFLVPFFSLSYPTNTPEKLDSFYTATYYTTGPLDACFIVSCIAIMAILRDAIRLGILEPFARWKLTGDLTGGLTERARKKTDVSTNGHSLSNGHGANGHSAHVPRRESRRMHRSVLRFAEQGWPVLYYAVQWAYGVVRLFFFLSHPCPVANAT